MMRSLHCSCLAANKVKVALLLALAMPLRQMFCSVGNDQNLLLGGAHAFVVPSSASMRHHHQRSTSQTRLLGLSEWRQGRAAVGPGGASQQTPLLLLPFPPSDLLPVGQSTTIVLKEGRYYDLFQDCIDDHESVLGMAILGDSHLDAAFS